MMWIAFRRVTKHHKVLFIHISKLDAAVVKNRNGMDGFVTGTLSELVSEGDSSLAY